MTHKIRIGKMIKDKKQIEEKILLEEEVQTIGQIVEKENIDLGKFELFLDGGYAELDVKLTERVHFIHLVYKD